MKKKIVIVVLILLMIIILIIGSILLVRYYKYKNFIGTYTLDKCEMKKIDFPLFSEKLYLSLYDIKNDQDTPYISSMKRIAQYPELFEAVGDNNRVLINNIINKEKIKRR